MFHWEDGFHGALPFGNRKIQIVFWDAALSTISDRLDYHTFSRGLLWTFTFCFREHPEVYTIFWQSPAAWPSHCFVFLFLYRKTWDFIVDEASWHVKSFAHVRKLQPGGKRKSYEENWSFARSNTFGCPLELGHVKDIQRFTSCNLSLHFWTKENLWISRMVMFQDEHVVLKIPMFSYVHVVHVSRNPKMVIPHLLIQTSKSVWNRSLSLFQV